MTIKGKAMTARDLGELLIKFGKRRVYVLEDEFEDTLLPITKATVTYNRDGVYFQPDTVIKYWSSQIQVYNIGELEKEV